MTPLTAQEIRLGFVNCSKGEAQRVTLPNLDELPWGDLDFLGWQDPNRPQRAYLVLERPAGAVGLVLRQTTPSTRRVRRSMLCQLCLTPHSGDGVTLSVARKTGPAGKKGDSTGIYACRDLACSSYLRGEKASGIPRLHETLPLEARAARCRRNLDQFVDRVLAGG